MAKRYFNTEGPCSPNEHYMVSLDGRLAQIKALVDDRKYFSINRGRQYGKTTTLELLQEKLREQYTVFYISFEGMAQESYRSAGVFCRMFAGLLYDASAYGETDGIADEAAQALEQMSRPGGDEADFRTLSNLISMLCETAKKPVVLLADEVDQAGNEPVFLSFLGMLRSQYLRRRQRPTFQSVILAGVYDIGSLKLKIRPGAEHQNNSPWNIAAKFRIDMSFSEQEIESMLGEYERDHRTGMKAGELARLIYAYTSGYPVLVSGLCKLLDEELAAAWTREGVLNAVKALLSERTSLFESFVGKLEDYPKLREMIRSMLLLGDKISYNPDSPVIRMASMFGFVKNENGTMVIANRIFETRLYNLFLSWEEVNSSLPIT